MPSRGQSLGLAEATMLSSSSNTDGDPLTIAEKALLQGLGKFSGGGGVGCGTEVDGPGLQQGAFPAATADELDVNSASSCVVRVSCQRVRFLGFCLVGIACFLVACRPSSVRH